MPPLWKKEARENSFEFLFFQGIRIVLFLWSLGWGFEIFLRLIPTGGSPVEAS